MLNITVKALGATISLWDMHCIRTIFHYYYYFPIPWKIWVAFHGKDEQPQEQRALPYRVSVVY